MAKTASKQVKCCEVCGVTIKKGKHCGWPAYRRRRFCSQVCCWKTRSASAKKSWKSKVVRKRRMVGIRADLPKRARRSRGIWKEWRARNPQPRKQPLESKLCRICGRKFKPKKSSWKSCLVCRKARPLCACGCGKRVKAIGSSGVKTVRRFITGHHCRTISFKKKASKRLRKLWEINSWRKRWLASSEGSMQKVWDGYTEEQRADRIRKNLCANNIHPNVPEKKLQKILNDVAPREFKLNVKGDVVIGGRIPDFVNVNGKKLVVEMFGEYWHGEKLTGRTRRKEEIFRKRCLKKFGFDTVVVWENELKDSVALRKKLVSALGLA